MAFFKSIWQRLGAFAQRRYYYIIVAAAAVVVGIGLAASYATVLDYTSSLNFCAHTCHEMQSTVYQEYKQSAHFKNQYGVVVRCSQCHVPHDNWPAVLGRKAMASLELYSHFVLIAGKGPDAITKAFQARRYELAKRVWAGFKADNAAECKACHKYSNMVLADQRPSIRAQHTDAMKTDENCLDCHKGITHHVPADPNAKPAPANSFDIQ